MIICNITDAEYNDGFRVLLLLETDEAINPTLISLRLI